MDTVAKNMYKINYSNVDRRVIICFTLIISWFLFGCQKSNGEEILVTPTNSPRVSEPSSPTPSPTVLESIGNTQIPSPTARKTQDIPPTVTLTNILPSPTYTSTPIPLSDGSFLWIFDQDSSKYNRIDLGDGSLSIINLPTDCSSLILPGTNKVICSSGSYTYVFDLLTEEKTELGATTHTALWFNISPNGRFLYYGFSDESYSAWTIKMYDLSMQTEKTLAENISSENWLELPVLSADGNHLVLSLWVESLDTRVFELGTGIEEYVQVGIDSPRATSDISWSPISLSFVYGATDINQEFIARPNYLFLANLETGKNRLLAQAPEGSLYNSFAGNFVWSADGKYIFASTENELCIIEIEDGSQVCHQIPESDNEIKALAWSPSGKYIAIGCLDKIYIFDLESGEFLNLLSDISGDSIFWR